MEDQKTLTKDLLPPLPKNIKILTTLAILIQNVAFGATLNFYSPALEDLRIKYDTSIEDISKVFTVLLVVYCIGALSAGFVYEKINRQCCIIILIAGMAFSLYITPHCPTLLTYFCAGGVLGYSAGAYDVGQMVWMMEIWQSKAGPFIQAQNFCYALGTNIPPLLLAPFLIKVEEDQSFDNQDQIGVGFGNFSTSSSETSRIYIPFTIGGAFASLGVVMQIGLFIFFRYYTPPLEEDLALKDKDSTALEDKEEEDNIKESKFKGINWSKIRLVILSALFLGAYVGMEMCTFQFIPTFGQYSELKLSESDAALVLSGLTGAFAVGRFIGIFLVLKIKPIFVLVGNLLLILIGNSILLIWANNNLTLFWTACILLGTGYSTVYPSFCAYMERHLVFTNVIGGCLILSGSGIAAVYPLIVGKSIEDNAVILTYTNFFSIALCFIALAIVFNLTYKSKERLR